MNDFDRPHTPDTTPDLDALAAGLLPRDHASRGATFVRRPNRECEQPRMYQALAVRIESELTTLLVGPHSSVSPTQTYRIEAVQEVASGQLATIQFRPTSARLE